jgi:acyl-CoA synthetase (AMP-forming)/AMP-acid ligase II
MIRLLEAAAAAAGDRAAVVTSEASSRYADLLSDARRTAAALAERRVSRFAVLEADALRVLRLLGGAAWMGAEPCQYQPDMAAGEFHAQASALGHHVVVTRRRDLDGPFDVVDPDELLTSSAPVPPRSADSPLLIRTTGTTGDPKAARHDWAILTRTVQSVRPQPDDVWLLAYGLHQFAGLQVVQHALAAQATLVAPFPRQPRDGLDAMLRHPVTAVSATPTYWRFLLAEAHSRQAALPRLRQITLGGEAASDDLLTELRRTFPEARISHVYASTELGSIASVTDGRAGFSTAALVGPANPDSHLNVVDGELWVRARAGMLGYADAEAALPPPDEWRPTGDLVEVVGDRVHFRGRATDVINVGGVKVSPLPVEERITAVEGVAAARVFGRPNALTGAIVAAEVLPVPDADEEDVRGRIRSAVADLPRAWQPRSIRFVDLIETRGGKTSRRTT